MRIRGLKIERYSAGSLGLEVYESVGFLVGSSVDRIMGLWADEFIGLFIWVCVLWIWGLTERGPASSSSLSVQARAV